MKKSFDYTSDKIESKGFIDQMQILKYVSEEEIFSLVFGFKPKEYQYVTSPLRVDSDAGCWFEFMDGKLFFRDFAYANRPLDCFHVVRDYYNLPSFPSTLEFVRQKLIDNQNRKLIIPEYREEKEKFYMKITTRQFLKKDAIFWKQIGVSKQNLVDDSVFAVHRAFLYNTKNGDTTMNLFNKLCYAYTEFEDGRKKLYLPNNNDNKFITDCTKDDIGSIKHLVPFGRLLFIKKSYKDCRIIRNQGYNSIWFQNEGMIPSDDILYNLVKRFDRVIVFYDNDDAGITASTDLSNKINTYFPKKAKPLWLPEQLRNNGITDPAEYYISKGEYQLRKFLKEHENY